MMKMIKKAAVSCSLLLVLATGAGAGDISGTVVRVEEPVGLVVLDDGRMFQVTRESTILVLDEPVAIGTIEPGHVVVLRSAVPVAFREGQYIVISEGGDQPSALPRDAAGSNAGPADKTDDKRIQTR